MTARPIRKPPPRVRQRQRADGSWRVWWEPETPLRASGFEPVELDPARLTWSVREAERLNDLVASARAGGGALAVPKGEGQRTVLALIARYRQSPEWGGLRPATQRDYNRCFSQIEAKWGSSLVRDFTKPIVRAWYETRFRESGPFMAAALIRKLSILMSYAEMIGWRQDNPCLRLRLKTPAGRSRIAEWAELDALWAASTALGLPSIGLAIALAVFQGQRQTDLLAARRAHMQLRVATSIGPDGKAQGALVTPLSTIVEAHGAPLRDGLGRLVLAGVWIFVRSKRGNHGGLDLHPEVLPWLARQPPSDLPELLVYEPTGKAYTEDRFGHVWARVRARAAKDLGDDALLTLQFRDLRRTFGHLARSAGATERDVADALGNNAWKDPKLSGVYMPATALTANRAIAAVARPKREEG